MKRKLVTVDAETLLSTPMSKTMFIVDGLIPQGVNVLSGAAKIGKSWLMLWLGLQVSQGLHVWGIPTMHCDVLYLCLEDTLRRIKDRLFDLTDDSTRSFHLAVTCGLIGNGLEEEIINFLEDFPKTKLVIIDTLQKVRDSKGSAGKAGMYGNDYDDISSIKKIADEHDISIILVHHLRKLKDGGDPFNEVSALPVSPERRIPIMCSSASEAKQGRRPSVACGRDGGISGADPAFSRPEMGTDRTQKHRGNPQGRNSAIPFSGSGIYENSHRMGGNGDRTNRRYGGNRNHAQCGNQVLRAVLL